MIKICINTTKKELEQEKEQNRVLAEKIKHLERQIYGINQIQCEPKNCYG